MGRKKPEPPLLTDVEIPDIFAGLEQRGRRPRVERERQTSVAFGACPGCSHNRIGLVGQGAHLAWRDHNLQTHGGISMQCSAVGQRLCDLPARDVYDLTGQEPPACTCTKR